MPEQTPHVAVTIASRDRPRGCRRLVEAILKQEVPADWQVRIVVVDNAPEGSGIGLPDDPRVELLSEPETGIPFARNRGVDHVQAWADVIVFIDDDEMPSEGWLRSLVEGLDRYEADVVTGPIRSVLPASTPDWIAQHPVFQRPVHEAGIGLTEAPTSNTAVRSTLFADGLRFDPAFRYTGGSDTQLFRQIHRSGGRIRWVSDAPVDELVPSERATARWVLARSFRIGANRVQFLLAERRSVSRWLVTLLGSGMEVFLGALAPATALLSRRRALIFAGRMCRGIGTYAALIGVRYSVYK